MKLYFLHGTNLPENVDRAFLIKTFQQFGDITKIYLNPDTKWFKIYFKEKEYAVAAASLDKSPPHVMHLEVKSEDSYRDNKRRKEKQTSLTGNNSNDNMLSDDSNCYADTGPDYYNIHGVAIATVTSDDGTVYVPLDEVREIGFELFEDSKIPKNLNFNTQALNEFRIFLNIQARKYIEKMQWSRPPDKIIEETKNEVINKYIGNGQQRISIVRQFENTSSPSYNSVTQTANKNYTEQGKAHQSGGFDKQRNTRPLPTRTTKTNQSPPLPPMKPLRQPFQTNDAVSQDRQTVGNESKYAHSETESIASTNGIINNNNTPNKENISPILESTPKRKETRNGEETPKMEENLEREVTPKKEETLESHSLERKHFSKISQAKYKQVELILNKAIKVRVASIESQKVCWAYKTEDVDRMTKILYDTNIAVRSGSSVQPSVGQMYAALYEGAWYRAVVQEETPNLKVQYIDFGNYNEEKLKEVRELPPEILSEPMLSIHLKFRTQPETTLVYDNELTIIPTKKNIDGSYDVEEVSEKPRTPVSPLNLIPAGKIVSSHKSANVSQDKSLARTKTPVGDKPKVSTNNQPQTSSCNQSDRKSTPSPSLTLKERLRNMVSPHKPVENLNPNRKCVVELIDGDSGIVQFIDKLNNDTCLGFICAFSYGEDLDSLENISESERVVGKVGDFVSVFSEESSSWVRATILSIENDLYTVASVDYGKIFSTKTVCKLEKKFVDIPEFLCVLSGNAECMNLLEETNSAEFSNVENNTIKMSFNDVFYNVACTRWNPFDSLKTTTTTIMKSNETIYTTPPKTKKLGNRERILPIMLNEKQLLVRNKESNVVLAKVVAQISKHTALPLTQDPIVGQLVLCPHDTQTILCRGIIKELNKGYAEVEFIDYGFTYTIPVTKIMAITESLANEDSSLIPVLLKGFEDGGFSDEVMTFLQTAIENKTKYFLKKCSDDVFDIVLELLPTGEVTLSSKLTNSAVTSIRRMYEDTPVCEMKIGETVDVVCVAIEKETGLVILISNDNLKEKMCQLNEEILECIKTDTESYSPIIGELCLAKYDGEWYRAGIVEENKALDMFNVYYLDFGNTATVSSLDIRKISDKCSQYPALALTGYVKEIANKTNINQKILNVINREVTVGESYNVEFLEKLDKSKYVIKIPSVSLKLSEIAHF